MRYIPIATTIAGLLVALFQLPGLWSPERDLGVMSLESLQIDGAAKIAAMTTAESNKHIKNEMRVLREEPLDQDAHRTLAMLSMLPPVKEKSRDIILNLARYSVRNPAIQMAAMSVLLEQNKLPETLYRIDAVLRSTPTLSEQLFPLIAENFGSKEGVKTVVVTLAEQPPWRRKFLTYLASQPTYERLTLDVLHELRKSAHPATAIELRSIFATWIKANKSYEKSYFVWLDQLSTEELRLAKGIYDGDFTAEPKNLYFDWNVASSRNGRASVVLKPGSGADRSLLVDFVGNREPFAHVSQYLQLSPGKFVLTFDMMSKKLTTEAGLVWRILCIEKNTVVGESFAIKSTSQWINMSVDFEIPEQECGSQVIRLETKARNGLDTAVDGQVYFDAFAIRPADSGKLL